MKTLLDVLSENHTLIQYAAGKLPLPGLTEWFLAEFIDELAPDECTMDKISAVLTNYY